MKNLASEFQEIAAAYNEIGEELARDLELADSSNSRPLVQGILKKRHSLSRIEHMNSRVLLVSSEWKKSRTSMDSQSWDEVSRLAENALMQAARLNELCSLTAKKIQSAKDRLESELAEVGKGACYLKSAKSSKTNYPKFIDSMY